MKMKTKTITVTAIMIALCVVVQLLKTPGTLPITGGLINLILIIDTLYCGLLSGVIVSVVAPVTSFIITQSAIISTVPMILPFIMLGNIVIVLFAWFVRGKKLELNLLPLSLVAGSFAKWAVMNLLIVKWIIPTFGSHLSPKMTRIAGVTYSTTQLYAALLGTAAACIIWPVVRIAVKRLH